MRIAANFAKITENIFDTISCSNGGDNNSSVLMTSNEQNPVGITERDAILDLEPFLNLKQAHVEPVLLENIVNVGAPISGITNNQATEETDIIYNSDIFSLNDRIQYQRIVKKPVEYTR